MTYPKLWQGPDAVGEAKSRHLQTIDAPYLTASGPGFTARKMGAFCEVTREPVEPPSNPDQVFISGWASAEQDDSAFETRATPLSPFVFHPSPRRFHLITLIGKGRWATWGQLESVNEGYELAWTDPYGVEQEEFLYGRGKKHTFSSGVMKESYSKTFYAHYAGGVGSRSGGWSNTVLPFGDGKVAFLFTDRSDYKDQRGAPNFIPVLRVMPSLEDESLVFNLPAEEYHSYSITRACCVTAPGEMVVIAVMFYAPFGARDAKGGIVSYRITEYGERITSSRSLTDLEGILFKDDSKRPPDVDLQNPYVSSSSAAANDFSALSSLVALDDQTLMLIACYTRGTGVTWSLGGMIFGHKVYLLSIDGGMIGEVPSDMRNVYHDSQDYPFHPSEVVPLGGGKALVIACDGYVNAKSSAASFYLADKSGVSRISPIGFPESATKIVHFGCPKVFKAYTKDTPGDVRLSVWSGEGYDLYRSLDNGSTWKKFRTIKKTDYFLRLDSASSYSDNDYNYGDAVGGYNFGWIDLASTPARGVPLDVAWPKRLGNA